MESAPVVLIEDSNHGESNHGSDSNVHHSVVAADIDLAIEHLVEGSQVSLLDPIHKDGSKENEGAVIHLLIDNITNHGPFGIGAHISTSAIVAREV